MRDVKLFLEGRPSDLSHSLRERMAKAAQAEEYERAAKYRDLISTVEQLQEKQRIAAVEGDDADVFGYHYENGMLAVNLFHMRGGRVLDRREFFWEDLPEFEQAPDAGPEPAAGRDRFHPGEFFSALLKQLYIGQPYVPRNIYVPVEFEDRESLAELLSEQLAQSGARASRVQIMVPQRGDKRSLIDLAGNNAKQSYDQRFRVMKPNQQAIQESLQDTLGLPDLPRRIECFDISHIQGAETVASMVVWEDGADEKIGLPQIHHPHRRRCRRFRVHARSGHAPLQAPAGGRKEADAEPDPDRRRPRATARRRRGAGSSGNHQSAAGLDRQARRNHLRAGSGERTGRSRPSLAGAAPGADGPR